MENKQFLNPDLNAYPDTNSEYITGSMVGTALPHVVSCLIHVNDASVGGTLELWAR